MNTPLPFAPRRIVDPDHPWPGLDSFDERSRGFFKGREAETERLVRLVRAESLTVVYGRSGLGKTSLLRAGLCPELRDRGFLPIYLRLVHKLEVESLTRQVFDELARAAAAARVTLPAPSSSDDLWTFFQRSDTRIGEPDTGLQLTPVLVLDQFEEIFTSAQEHPELVARVAAFLTELEELVENRPPARVQAELERDVTAAGRYDFDNPACKIVLSLREDFLPMLEQFRGRLRGVVDNRFRLVQLNGEQALRVVREPAGRLVDEAGAEQIVRFAADSRPASFGEGTLAELSVEPWLLSLVLTQLNERRLKAGAATITGDMLSGSQDEILRNYYLETLDRAGVGAAGQAFLEDRLLTDSGYRRMAAEEELVAPGGLLRPQLGELENLRLIHVESRGKVRFYELTHDRLAPVVQASREARREQAARESQRLREAEMRRQLWRSRRLTATFGVLALAAVVATILAWGSRQAALTAERAAVGEKVRAVAAEQRAAAARADAEQKRQAAEEASHQASRQAAAAEAARGEAEAQRANALQAQASAQASEQRAVEARLETGDLLRSAIVGVEELASEPLRRARDEMRGTLANLKDQVGSSKRSLNAFRQRAEASPLRADFEQRYAGFLALAAEALLVYGDLQSAATHLDEARALPLFAGPMEGLPEPVRQRRLAQIERATGAAQLLRGENGEARARLRAAREALAAADASAPDPARFRLHVMIELDLAQAEFLGLDGRAAQARLRSLLAILQNQDPGSLPALREYRALARGLAGLGGIDFPGVADPAALAQAETELAGLLKEDPQNRRLRRVQAEWGLGRARADFIGGKYRDARGRLVEVLEAAAQLRASDPDGLAGRLLRARAHLLSGEIADEQARARGSMREDLIVAEADAVSVLRLQGDMAEAQLLRVAALSRLSRVEEFDRAPGAPESVTGLVRRLDPLSLPALRLLEFRRAEIWAASTLGAPTRAAEQLAALAGDLLPLQRAAPDCATAAALAGRIAYDRGELLARAGQLAAARECFRQAEDIAAQGGDRWPDAPWFQSLAAARLRQAELAADQADLEAAAGLYHAAVRTAKEGLGYDVGHKRLTRSLIVGQVGLARTYARLGLGTDAANWFGRAVDLAVDGAYDNLNDRDYADDLDYLRQQAAALAAERGPSGTGWRAAVQEAAAALDDPATFRLRPLLANGWRRAPERARLAEIARLAAWARTTREGAALRGMLARIDRGELEVGGLRRRSLGFYPDAELVELVLRQRGEFLGLLAYVAYRRGGNAGFVVLDGGAEAIRRLNESAGIRLETNAAMDDYLRFYIQSRAGDKGCLRVVDLGGIVLEHHSTNIWQSRLLVAGFDGITEAVYELGSDGGVVRRSADFRADAGALLPVTVDENGLRRAMAEDEFRIAMLMRRGEWEDAAVLLRHRLDGTAAVRADYWRLSTCHLYLADYARALAVAEEGLAFVAHGRDPGAAMMEFALRLNRAHALLLLGRVAAAREIYFSPANWDEAVPGEPGGLWQDVAAAQLASFGQARLRLPAEADVIGRELADGKDPYERLSEAARWANWHGDPRRAARLQEEAIDYGRRKWSGDEISRERLAAAYDAMAFYRLLLQDFAGLRQAIASGREAGGERLVFDAYEAHLLLYEGRAAEAERFHRERLGRRMGARRSETWEEAVLRDLDQLEKAGLGRPEFARLRALLRHEAAAPVGAP